MATSRLERIGTIFTRKQTNEGLLTSLSDVLTSLEADHNALKDNQEKLEHLTGAFMKCIQQTTLAHKQKLKALKDIHSSFQKETEGLLKRGAIKPDDRPLWFDVYKAFPPITEPKFARPKVENKTIRPILYKEDVIRAKFHARGLGLTINMQTSSGETHIKRLIKQYEKLKDEGVPENELIERAALATDSERQNQQYAQNVAPKKVDTANSKLSEANIENIFKE